MTDVQQMAADLADSETILDEQAEAIGENLLRAVVEELSLIPHPTIQNQSVWSVRKQDEQDETIERFTRRVRTEVLRAFRVILADGNPLARATLDQVVFSDKGIKGTLSIDKHSGERHALADFAGQEVAVIMPDDLDEFFESMAEVRSVPDQQDFIGRDDEEPPMPGDGNDDDPKPNSPDDLGFDK